MSGKHSAVMFIFIMAIGLAAFRAEDARAPFDANLSRRPSSIGASRSFAVGGMQPASKKAPLETSGKSRVHKHTEKLSGPLSTSIELIGAAPNPGDTFVLKGLVVGASAIENVEFKWILPEGVELVNGEQSGSVTAISADKPFEMQVTLRQVSEQNQQVHLQVLATSGAQKFGHTSQYNTLTEQLLQSSRKELLKSTEEYEAKNKQKIMH